MSILKSPKTTKNRHRPSPCRRISKESQLERYAEFIDASPSYVITEVLKLLSRKDNDFILWADQYTNNHNNEKAKGDVLAKAV